MHDDALRGELVGVLAHLADVEYQRSVWLSDEEPTLGHYYDDFQTNCEFLFDATAVASDPAAEIGRVLTSQAEADAIRRVVDAIDRVLEQVGRYATQPEVIGSAGWSDVVSSSRAAIETLSRT